MEDKKIENLPDTDGDEQDYDPVQRPKHYTSGNIEVIDFIDSCGYGLGFCLGNAIKYTARCLLKGTPVQDLEKAQWYLNHAAKKIQDGTYNPETHK